MLSSVNLLVDSNLDLQCNRCFKPEWDLQLLDEKINADESYNFRVKIVEMQNNTALFSPNNDVSSIWSGSRQLFI